MLWHPYAFVKKTISNLEKFLDTSIKLIDFSLDNLDILFITTASFKLNDQEKKNEHKAGSLFKTKLDIKGNKTNKFIQFN